MNNPAPITVIQPGGRSLFSTLKELWHFRELVYFFTWRDLKVRYKQTILGFLWVILQPLAMMGIFVAFFSRTLKLPTDEIPAPVFYLCGLLAWNFFSTSVASASNSMVSNANIIRKVYFPRLAIPLSSLVLALVDFAIALGIFIAVGIYYRLTSDAFRPHVLSVLLTWVPAITLAAIASFGIGSGLAAMNVRFRDFRYVLPFLLQFLFFLTPVIYPISVFGEERISIFLSLNPMTAVIELIRFPFGQLPMSWDIVLPGIFTAFLLGGVGTYFFLRNDRETADLI